MMNEEKSREELLAELAEMRRCLDGLTASEANLKLLQEETLLLERTIIAVNEAENMDAAFFAVLWKICSATDWVYGEVWVPRPDGKLLERSPVWYGTAAGLGDFSASSEGLRFAPGEGLPGRAWLSKKYVWINDITQDDSFQRDRIAKEAGIKTGLAVPVLAKDETLAVLVFYMFETREEDEQLLRFMLTITAHLGSVIRRKKAEEELQRSEEYLPASSGEAKVEVTKDKVPEISGGKERILLVENERDVRTIALLMLGGKGYKLLTASNYEEAVTVFQQEKGEIDLLFTDIMLPDRSGLELAKELKLRKPDLMVLLTSGYSSEHLQIQNLLLDDYRLLEKPYTMEQLLHTIREMTKVKKPTA